jgi:hypothetical protein
MSLALFNGAVPNEELMCHQTIINGEQVGMCGVAACFIRRDNSVNVVTSLLDG